MKIVGVAFQKNDLLISLPSPNRHHHLLKVLADNEINHIGFEQGFLSDCGIFLSRSYARGLAMRNGQCPEPRHSKYLFSEDLW